jgi:hypothetical protein
VSAANYQSIVQGDGPRAYYRLSDATPPDVAINRGTLGAAGNGTHGPGVLHRVAGALVGNPNAATSYSSTPATTHTFVPYQPALNPPSGSPFSVEFWANPSVEVSDSPGPCPLFNRVSAGNRSGWVFYQRSITTGWNFRMYNGSGSNLGIDISGGSNAQGTWSHVVAVWDGAQARLYVNGALVAGPTTPTGGYNASTSAIFSIGSYDDGVQNPFNGSMDEVAFYTNALSAAQVLTHYQNGINPAPSTPYASVVAGDHALEYLRLDEAAPMVDTAINLGSLGVNGDGLHFPGMAHQVPGALAGNSDTAAGYTAIDQSSTDGGVPTRIAYRPELNTPTFTIEAWLKPTIEGAGNAQAPIYNRKEDSPRTGWVFFQRDHNTGWNFRAYNGVDTSRSIDITGGPYTIGAWVHLAATFDGSTGRLYVNGTQVGSQAVVGSYAPNSDTIQFCVGGYFDGSQNPFTGSIDEVAEYNTALSAGQILAHYQNGTNAARVAPYESLIATDGAVEYLRLDEPAKNVAANLGTLGSAAAGTYVNTTNGLAGPQSPALAGFETNNIADSFDGVTTYIELMNPAGLNISGPITLEAWVQPAALQGGFGDIIAHGGNDTGNAEMVLRVNTTSSYQVSSWDGVTSHGVSAAIPPEDVGTGAWVHLVGTYDGTNWNLYRNAVSIASAADPVGALVVSNANWAIGARGRWKNGLGFPTSGEDRVFTGGIDEAAIYNYALTPHQVSAHFSMGLLGPNPLTISHSGANVILTWPTGTLQQATSVTGPFTDTGAVSPYTTAASAARLFYRIRL